jgi:hypothetical protein
MAAVQLDGIAKAMLPRLPSRGMAAFGAGEDRIDLAIETNDGFGSGQEPPAGMFLHPTPLFFTPAGIAQRPLLIDSRLLVTVLAMNGRSRPTTVLSRSYGGRERRFLT